MCHRAIEIHDSVLDQIEASDAEARLHFSTVYVHQSEGMPLRNAGTVWIQRAILHIAHPRILGAFSELPVRLSDGRTLLGENSTDNEIPVPLHYEGRFELRLEAFRKTNEVVTFVGSVVELELIGEAKYLERFRP